MSMPLKEFTELSGLSDISSDSDSEPAKVAVIAPAQTNPIPIQAILDDINAKLDRGQQIDLSRYTKIYVVTFRGLNFFKNFFSQEERRATRRSIRLEYALKDRRHLYSPAIYKLAGLKLGDKIDTAAKKKKVRNAVKLLKENFSWLENAQATKASYYDASQKNALFQAHQMYVNTYESFRERCPFVLAQNTNPFISTTRDPRHAVLYALGYKAKKEYGCLRPTYIGTKQGIRAKHSKVGYVEIIFHTLLSIRRNYPLITTVCHKLGWEKIDTHILNECEFTFKIDIKSKHNVGARIVRFPSFPYAKRVDYLKKYNLTPAAKTKYFNAIREGMTQSETTKKTKLLDVLAIHYAAKLREQASIIAEKNGGIAVYLGDDGHLYATPEKCCVEDSSKFKASLEAFQSPNGYDSGSESEEEITVVLPVVTTGISSEHAVTAADPLIDELSSQFGKGLSLVTSNSCQTIEKSACRNFHFFGLANPPIPTDIMQKILEYLPKSTPQEQKAFSKLQLVNKNWATLFNSKPNANPASTQPPKHALPLAEICKYLSEKMNPQIFTAIVEIIEKIIDTAYNQEEIPEPLRFLYLPYNHVKTQEREAAKALLIKECQKNGTAGAFLAYVSANEQQIRTDIKEKLQTVYLQIISPYNAPHISSPN